MSLIAVANEVEKGFNEIPIIDLSHIDDPDPAAKAALVASIRDACINVGFLYVKNHGIPQEVIDGALGAAKDFFSLSEDKKMEIVNTKTPNYKGYNPLFSSSNDPDSDGDMHEGFEFGWEELVPKINDEKRANDGVMAGANIWPDEPVSFREAELTYYHAAVDLGRKLFPLFALALDLPENFFEDKTKNAAALMRVLHYPPQTGPVDGRTVGIGAHTDWECFTILWQEPGIQALQVLNREEQWINAPPIPGTLVINLGDQFARWTNDIFKSTVHRAINRSGVRRYSIPLFFGTDYDVKLEPIPSCVSPDRPPKYEVVTAGVYVKEKLKATYGHYYPRRSPSTHAYFVKEYGRNVYIRGPFPWDQRLFTLDPVTMNHILQHTTVYEKPWPSRRLISNLIGVGMLSAEGQVHKRQRRVALPAFSAQTMRALVPLVFNKATELRNKWTSIIREAGLKEGQSHLINVCSWASRATFDVMGSAGFDYEFNAIQDGDNELLRAYSEMFEVAVSRPQGHLRTTTILYFPTINSIFPDHTMRFIAKCQEVIRRVAGRLIQEKKRKIAEAEASGKSYQAKDLLTLLLKSNSSVDLAPEQRISDEEMLHMINTFMFAGTDTTSLAMTWTLYLLAKYPDVQTRLRTELLSAMPSTPIESLTEDEIQSLYAVIAELPYLDNVIKETLRLIPPVHSSIRVAMQDDMVPTSSPLKRRTADGEIVEEHVKQIHVPKGTFIHVPIEGFQLDKEIWGESAWSFNPDRWNELPAPVQELPGIYSHLLAFSAGPRACIGTRMSTIELKSFLFTLVSNFTFTESETHKIGKANVVLTRPYVAGQENEGSMLPLLVAPYIPSSE
ncbi:hypothetical protein NM688_g949 [Phlebia brevispora]|uniref:Uncharacterized protein n=1 Tax=Phlebia brevispora TaxID=194682 RepID=A0ACC1TCW6_9APHY|nr:hypothetical protein NM688_g949 [Phlebia brevispora]